MRQKKIAPFTCIRECLFAESRIDQHFKYPLVLARGRTAKETLIDVGCCMGTDIRTLITDGYPAHVRHIYTTPNHLDAKETEADVRVYAQNIKGLDREIRTS